MALIPKIIRESIGILVLASVLSTIGGLGLEALKDKLALLLPLLILLPALNDMIGDFGTIISSKFTTLLFLGSVNERWWESEELGELFKVVAYVAIISAFYLGILSSAIAFMKGFHLDLIIALKVLTVALMSTASLVLIIFFVAIFGGLIVYARGSDPDNFLIPLTTSIADFGSLIIFAVMLRFLF